jgi:hypothetical protein
MRSRADVATAPLVAFLLLACGGKTTTDSVAGEPQRDGGSAEGAATVDSSAHPDASPTVDGDAGSPARLTSWDRFPRFSSIDGWCGSSLLFRGIWGSAPNDVWVVGTEVYQNGSTSPASAILHFNGSQWETVDWFDVSGTSTSMRTALLNSIWGSSAHDVWAVGSGGVVLHFDGDRWSGFGSITTADLNAVWGSAADDVWAVGAHGTIAHFDGASWAAASGSNGLILSGVWGSGSHDVWTVGSNGTAQHWNGSEWSTVSTGTTQGLGAVWGSSSKDVWAVGAANHGTVLHWDGAAWSAAPRSAPPDSGYDFVALSAVWGSGADDVWAAGAPACYSPCGSGSILHWDGTAWSTVSTQGAAPLHALWGSSSKDVWAVGAYGSMRWDGATWLKSDPSPYHLHAAWGSGPNSIWAVGNSGLVAHWDGDAWSISHLPSAPAASDSSAWGDARAIVGTDEGDVWATTDTPDLLHWDGRAWSSSVTGSSGVLRGVWAGTATNAWAVGDAGAIVHWAGKGWTVVASPTEEDLLVVSGAVPNDLWAAGSQGTLLHWGGDAWSIAQLPSLDQGWSYWDGTGWVPTATPMSKVVWSSAWSTGTDDVSVAGVWTAGDRSSSGAGPALTHWNGTQWSNSEQPYAGLGAWVAGRNDVWLVGTTLGGGYRPPLGQDIAHWDGMNWQESHAGGSTHLRGVWGNAQEIWAVGGFGVTLRKR